MNFDNIFEAKPELAPTPMGPSWTPAGAHTGTQISSLFKTADFVVYPAHGAGQLVAIENQTVVGANLELFVIYFAKAKMTLRVPVRKATDAGMRKLSDLSMVETAKRALHAPSRKGRGNWSRLSQEYQSKINSGDIIALAEVTRDLFRAANSEQSFSERQLYVSALDRLSGEIALVDGISTEEAVKELEDLMRVGKLKRSA